MELLKPIKLRKNIKKSGFEDAFFIIAVLFAMAIFLLILNKAWGDMRPSLEDSITGSLPAGSDVNITKNFDAVTNTAQLFDKLIPLLILGVFAFILIGASFYMNHPIMLIVGIIVLAVAVMLGIIYANVYNEISSSPEFSSTNAKLPITEIFMKYLPIILAIAIIGITAIIIYSRQGGTSST